MEYFLTREFLWPRSLLRSVKGTHALAVLISHHATSIARESISVPQPRNSARKTSLLCNAVKS